MENSYTRLSGILDALDDANGHGDPRARLIATKGVKHGQLVMTTTGKGL